MKTLKEIKEAVIYFIPVIIVGGFILTTIVIGVLEQLSLITNLTF